MRFSFTDDQRELAAGLGAMLAKECTPAHVRAVWDDGTGHDAALWARLGEMGVLSLLVAEGDGGMGATPVDAVLLFQELGRAAAPGPVLEHIVTAPVLAAAGVGDAAGTGIDVATAWLDGPYVAHAHVADVIVVPGGVLTGATLTDVHGIDGGRRLFAATGGTVRPVAFDGAALADALALATAAFLVGLGERMIDLAAEHARNRHQFGQPIGAFQAVKHLMADALLQVEFAKAPLYRAAWSLATAQPTAARDVSMAKALAGDAAYRASRAAMQVHGGIGYTWEADLQLWMKKAWALQRAHGDTAFHRRRVAAAVLDH